MKNPKLIYKVSALSLIFLNSYGANLRAPIGYTSANVLPPKIRNLQFTEAAAEVNDKLNNDGTIVPLGNSFNKSLSWNDLITNEADPVKRADYMAYLGSKGIPLNQYVGDTTGVVNVASNAQVYSLAYGLNDTTTLALAIPVAQIEVNSNASAISGTALNRVANDLAAEGKLDDANELRTKYLTAVQRKLSDNGYKPLVNEKKSKLGDLRLVGKKLITQNDKLVWSTQGELTIPTGVRKDINKLVDVPTSDGAYNIALAQIVDVRLNPSLTANTIVKYTAQLADTNEERVPNKTDTKISPDIDSAVKRDRGDIFEAGLGLSYEATEWLLPKVAANFQYKNKDSYTGTKFEQWRYDLLAFESTQNLLSAQLGAEINTVKLFKAKKFPVPMSATLNASAVVQGKNVNSDPLYTLNVSLFF